MILTYKIKHERDFQEELKKAKKIAEFAIKTNSRSSADVKHIGLKSAISNQILKKYSRNKRCKKVKDVKLTVPNQSIRVDKKTRKISIPCLKIEFDYCFRNDFEKINQIEVGRKYTYISVTVPEKEEIISKEYIGVDLNTTGHCAVVGNPKNGKVIKLGKKANHTHKKYSNMRKNFQRREKYKKLKEVKRRENRIIKDLNHKISRKIVETAKESRTGIKIEDLKGIRKTAKNRKSFRYSLNSWSFYQLQYMIEYKAKLLGIPVVYIAPQYTSQKCSRCGLIGNRNKKEFKCPSCGHVDHADTNASFNIAMGQSIGQFGADRDVPKGNTDVPREAIPRTMETSEPPML